MQTNIGKAFKKTQRNRAEVIAINTHPAWRAAVRRRAGFVPTGRTLAKEFGISEAAAWRIVTTGKEAA